ncbi:MAG: SUMF1/EgtB/PvdO family nonheme iron enzyme [Reyranella sp.]|nr:SUMF1/EgtB/PvdO family nonheme iron enzyme [Reyranella sp.]
MARIFLSHSSVNNAEAVALYGWLEREGWKGEIFLDLDPGRGIAAGERWERRLNEAASRCEAVLFLVSKAWIESPWCQRELMLAHRLNKQLFGVLIEDLAVADVSKDLAQDWQLVRLASGRDHVVLRTVLPISHDEVHVTFSGEGLQRLKHGLTRAGLDPKHFAWPPESDPQRPLFRGLRPLEAEDAGIFFGRDAPIVEALDRLRGLREGHPPRLLVILAASGAGKSSFLRAGLLPRLKRDDRHFLPLPIVRPERAVISGETGFVRALEGAFEAAHIAMPRADLRAAVLGGAATLRPLLQALVDKSVPGGAEGRVPMLVLSIDQGEELFLAEAQDEARPFLSLLRDLVSEDGPAVTVVFTIRSDNYERLQLAKELEGVHQQLLNLPPMPTGSYAEVIKRPVQRLQSTVRSFKIDDRLVDALLADIEVGGAKDALPLLAFTLERLYGEYHASGGLKLSHYDDLGRVKGSIEAAVERALKAADSDSSIPKDRAARLMLLRRGMVPWLAGIDPDTGAPRRRVARLSEIPADARPLMEQLVEQRLLATDVSQDTGESTVEPAHEALLRQWTLLQGWLAEDTELLAVLESIKRASRDWAASGRHGAWLGHATDRLAAAERLSDRPDLAASLLPQDFEYLVACRKAENASRGRKRRVQAVVYALLVGVIVGLVGWINQSLIKEQWQALVVTWPYMLRDVRPYVLAADAERALKPGEAFKECARYCPEMVVIPAGRFTMGSPPNEVGRDVNEGPQQNVVIAKPFAISKFAVTFDDWDACVSYGDCEASVGDSGFGRGRQPAVNVSWDGAKRYVAWLARMTGKPYRLLSEAEWEYAARAGSTTAFLLGDGPELIDRHAWHKGNSGDKPHPVGEKEPNTWGLYDMIGNVWQWLEDCFHKSHEGLSADGTARTDGTCNTRALRGGSFYSTPEFLRSAKREWRAGDNRSDNRGFRVAREISP